MSNSDGSIPSVLKRFLEKDLRLPVCPVVFTRLSATLGSENARRTTDRDGES